MDGISMVRAVSTPACFMSAGRSSFLFGLVMVFTIWFDGVAAKIDDIIDGFGRLKSFITGGGISAEVMHLISLGQSAIASATGSSLGAQTSNSLAIAGATNANKSVTVNVAPATVNTQATDAAGVAGALGTHLAQHIRQATNNLDDGVQW